MNQAVVVGKVLEDPCLRHASNGLPVARIKLEANRKGTEGGETLVIPVIVWRQLAEICAQFLKKGREIVAVGELMGDARKGFKLIASTVQFLGGPTEEDKA